MKNSPIEIFKHGIAKPMLSVVVFLLLISCSNDISYRYVPTGNLTSLRIDDDSEYHFSTDNFIRNDVKKYNLLIIRKDTIPTLFRKQYKCNSGICNEAPNEWGFCSEIEEGFFKIVIPKNYKIETFDD